jgi:hypothetical protein
MSKSTDRRLGARKVVVHHAGLWALVGSVYVGAGAGGAGCAEERDPIDRTQAGVLEKSFFVGDLEDFRDDPEFRTKSFNIDSGANTESHTGAIGGASAVERIRWEITENMLFARRSYQESPGADNRGLPRVEVSPGKWEFPTKPTGTVIAAYRIISHFDVRRDYNPATGEETNVVVENTNDRPWYKRAKMRVDWSKNLAQSTSGDVSWIFGQGVSSTAIEYSPTAAGDEDAPYFEKNFFDVTNKYQLAPEPLPGFGVPECLLLGFFNGTSSFDCTPVEVKMRTSFVKLTGEEDFEPFEESFAHRDIVGNWGNAGNSFNREYGAPPITAWDPQYGYTDAKTKTFYAFHNIWEKSHQAATCNDNADADADGTADACDNGKTGYTGSKGAQCDVHIGKCTLPVRDRSVSTVGYWLNPETPQEFTDEVSSDGKTVTRVGAIEEMSLTWNQLMRNAVATRREVECRRTKDGDRDTCHGLFFEGDGPQGKEMVRFGGWGIDRAKDLSVDKGRPVFATCHNPVRAYDPSLCGAPGTRARLGDLRKNYTIYWPFASRAPYGGVASIGADPLTGEMLGATATIMGRSATAAAAQQRDIIQIALGDTDINTLIKGGQVERYAELVRSGKVNGTLAESKTPEEHREIRSHVDVAHVREETNADALGLAALNDEARSLARAKLRTQDSLASPRIAADEQRLEAVLKPFQSSTFKADMANRGLQLLVAQSADKGSSVFRAIDTFANMDPSKAQDLFDRYQSYLSAKGVCFHDNVAAAGAGSMYQPSLAPYFKKKYGDLDPTTRGVRIYEELLREAIKGIGFHEIGHSIGMRHNFSSSWDAQNFAPQYWQLRTNEGRAANACPSAGRSGASDTCMGPRYLDPMTQDEEGLDPNEPRPGIDYFANTSTMEYQIERFGETVGAGTYDLHFAKTLYGRVLETMDDRLIAPADQQYHAVKTLSQGIPDTLAFVPGKGYGVHYTKNAVMTKVFDPQRDCRDATPEERETAKWRIVHGKLCAPSPKNHLAYEDMKSSEIAFTSGKTVTPIGANGVRWAGTDENGQKLVRWHYRYGEDYSRGGYSHAKPGDSGADMYEITASAIRRYELTYPWQYFRRLNKEFAWWSLPNSVDASYFARLRGYHWNTTTNISRAGVGDLDNPDKDQPSVYASDLMFNFFQRVVLTPEPGSYGDTTRRTPARAGAAPIFDLMTGTGTPAATVSLLDGRYVQTEFDNDRGGSWDYSRFPEHVGFDEEKSLAIRELVDSRPSLSTISRDNALDGRDPYISFRTDRPQALDRLLGSLLAEDWEAIAPVYLTDKTIMNTNLSNPTWSRPTGGKLLFPNTGYANAISSAIYSLVFSRFSTDLTLANKLRIRFENDNGPKIPDARRISFVDPETHYRYVATRFGTETFQGRVLETGIASRMIAHANELLATAYEVKEVGGVPVLDAFGEPELVLVGGAPVVKNGAAAKTFRRYIGLLDGVRQVGNIFGQGPLGGGGGGSD